MIKDHNITKLTSYELLLKKLALAINEDYLMNPVNSFNKGRYFCSYELF